MRNALAREKRPLSGAQHFGYAYELLVPPPLDGFEKARDLWLNDCAKIAVHQDYERYFRHWSATFSEDHSQLETIKLKSRLLVGHGNPSGADVGLTVHRAWGVPMIPGSALKGLLANYLATTLGPHGGEDDAEREKWRGVVWRDGLVDKTGAPGEYFKVLFGSPSVAGLEDYDSAGKVEFHDALYVPGSAPGNQPFVRDVLTVHQSQYYKDSGAAWPNDWESPIPVGFITVRPEVQFFLAVSSRDDGWAELAMKLLLEALNLWGAGAKTAAGYGRAAALGVR